MEIRLSLDTPSTLSLLRKNPIIASSKGVTRSVEDDQYVFHVVADGAVEDV